MDHCDFFAHEFFEVVVVIFNYYIFLDAKHNDLSTLHEQDLLLIWVGRVSIIV